MKVAKILLSLCGLVCSTVLTYSHNSDEAEENWRMFGGLKTKFRSKKFYIESESKAKETLKKFQESFKDENQTDKYFAFKPTVGYIPIYPEDPKLDGNKMFYWLFDSKGNPDTDPLVIWLQGGPGCASTYGLFTENGPFYVENYSPDEKNSVFKGKKFADERKIAWNQKANLLFPDQPIGVGFSEVTNNMNARNYTMVMEQFLRFYQGFLEKYPKFKGREVYITGESFGGHWVPYTAYSLFSANDPNINLAGIAIGNGYISGKIMFSTYANYSLKYQQYTNLTQKDYEVAKKVGELCIQLVDFDYSPMYAAAAIEICNTASDLSLKDASENFNPYYMPSNITGNSSFYYFLNDKDVQADIGVNKHFSSCNGTFGDEYFLQDYWVDSREFIVPMLEAGVKTLIYDGDLDWICNYQQEEKIVNEMVWSGQKQFQSTKLDKCLIGKCKQYLNLRYVRFAGAGHMVPSFKPENALNMINDLLDW